MALCIWVLIGESESQPEKSLTPTVEIVFASWRVMMIEGYGNHFACGIKYSVDEAVQAGMMRNRRRQTLQKRSIKKRKLPNSLSECRVS